MRRLIGPVLVGLGVFLVVAAALARFYAYPALARVPDGYHSTTKLEAIGAQIFNSDPAVLAPETHDLDITSKTSEDVGAKCGDNVVWVNVTTTDKVGSGNFQKSTERAAFDPVTGAGATCSDDQTWDQESDGITVENVPTDFKGQVYKFPFNTQKKTYQVWDGPTGEATPATFEGEDTVKGLKVYKFVQVIDPVVIDTPEVPGSIFGSDEAKVTADMRYAMTRTLYIEPVTGSPVLRIDDRTQELVYNGQTVPAFIGNVHYTDAQVSSLVDDLKTKSMLLGGLRVLYPTVMVLLGLLLLGLGLMLNRRAEQGTQGDRKEERPLVTA